MNWYINPITNHYFDFQGTSGRQEFWMFVLFNLLISLAIGIVGNIIHLPLIGGLYSLAVLLPALGIEVRRMHDVGKSGWWILVALIPILGWIYVIYLLAQPSATPYGSTAAA